MDTQYIRAGDCGQDVTVLIGDDGGYALHTRGQFIPVDAVKLAEVLERTRPVAGLVARSVTPISGMSAPVERSLRHFGCARVAISKEKASA